MERGVTHEEERGEGWNRGETWRERGEAVIYMIKQSQRFCLLVGTDFVLFDFSALRFYEAMTDHNPKSYKQATPLALWHLHITLENPVLTLEKFNILHTHCPLLDLGQCGKNTNKHAHTLICMRRQHNSHTDRYSMTPGPPTHRHKVFRTQRSHINDSSSGSKDIGK